MTWQHKFNEALGEYAGVQFSRVRKATPESPARPPADAADRLSSEPVFILSPVRSGSTLLRSMLDAHSLIHAPHESHVRRLAVEWQDKIRSGSVQPGRELPAPEEVPETFRAMCRSWGYS